MRTACRRLARHWLALIASVAAGLLLGGGCSPGSSGGPAPAGGGEGAPSAKTARARREPVTMSLTSSSFSDGGAVPTECTCDGLNRSPSLRWTGAPPGTRSFALIVHDPDSPSGDFTHWLLYDIPAGTTEIAEGGAAGTPGSNDFGKSGYGGPCPPAGSAHHYVFDLYAVDRAQTGPARGARRSEVEAAIRGHVVAQAELRGVYGRN